MLYEEDFDPRGLDVRIAELMVATSERADEALDNSLQEVLKLLQAKLHMDVVFVSEFFEGRRVFRQVEQKPGISLISVGDSDELEGSWCQRVVDGRLPQFIDDGARYQADGSAPATPFPVGTHLSVPLVLSDGQVYGTLCCFSHHVNGNLNAKDVRTLSYTAELAADRIEKARRERGFDAGAI
jgi:GAF domain-containing protein